MSVAAKEDCGSLPDARNATKKMEDNNNNAQKVQTAKRRNG